MADNVVPIRPATSPSRDDELSAIREDLAVAAGMLTEAQAAADETGGGPLSTAIGFARGAVRNAQDVAGTEPE